MAQLYFKYGAMGSSKTANALMARFNYEERGQATLLVKPRLDTRDGDHMVSSRIGLTHPCIYFDEMQQMTDEQLQQYACIIVDEAQFLQKADIYYLVHLVDDCNIPVMCYGLRADFKGELFPGSYHLLVMADKLEEVKTICWVRQEGRLQRPLRSARPCGEGGRSGGAGSQRQVHWPLPPPLDGRGFGAGLRHQPGMICNICPRRCGAERTETYGGGFCRMPAVPVIARAGLHLWEEPVLSGTRGSGAVFFSGCSLGCVYCQNHTISAEGVGKAVTTERLREIFRELIAQGAHNIDLITASHFVPFLLPALEEPLPVPVVFNCGGYERVETLRLLEGKVQILAAGSEIRAGGAGPALFPRPGLLSRGHGGHPGDVPSGGSLPHGGWSAAAGGGHPPSGAAGTAGKHPAGHRLGGPDLPSGGGAVLPHEPVYSPARRRGAPAPPCDGGGVPCGGGIHGKLRHRGRLRAGAYLRP